MRSAPVLILVWTSEDTYLDRYAEPDKGWIDRDPARWSAPYWFADAGMASMAALLSAVDQDLGACFFGIPVDRANQLRTVPHNGEIVKRVKMKSRLLRKPKTRSSAARRSRRRDKKWFRARRSGASDKLRNASPAATVDQDRQRLRRGLDEPRHLAQRGAGLAEQRQRRRADRDSQEASGRTRAWVLVSVLKIGLRQHVAGGLLDPTAIREPGGRAGPAGRAERGQLLRRHYQESSPLRSRDDIALEVGPGSVADPGRRRSRIG